MKGIAECSQEEKEFICAGLGRLVTVKSRFFLVGGCVYFIPTSKLDLIEFIKFATGSGINIILTDHICDEISSDDTVIKITQVDLSALEKLTGKKCPPSASKKQQKTTLRDFCLWRHMLVEDSYPRSQSNTQEVPEINWPCSNN